MARGQIQPTFCFYHCALAADGLFFTCLKDCIKKKKKAQQTVTWPTKPKTFIAGPLQDSLPIPATTPYSPPHLPKGKLVSAGMLYPE